MFLRVLASRTSRPPVGVGCADVYSQPTKPIHLINGAAGCPEDLDPWQPDQPEWSVVNIAA
jgi:hypothetical protein